MRENFIALLPMKGHSERVRNKNLRDFNGRPLFWHILHTLLICDYVSGVYVDTDDVFLGETVKHYFPDVQIMPRAKELCGDHISMNKIIQYDISHIEGEYFLQTHATNPLLEKKTIDDACKIFFENLDRYDSLFTVNRMQSRLYDANGKAINHNPNELIRTQDLSPIYEENSNLYLFSKESFGKREARIGEKPYLYATNKLESLDIDEEEDFILAEMVQRMKKKGDAE